MNWADLQGNWARSVDLIVMHFPHTNRLELAKLDGDLSAFAYYLGRVHDLTVKEAMDAIDFVLLKDHGFIDRAAKAA